MPSGVQRHIPGNRVIKVPSLRAGGILIPAKKVVAFPYRLFIGSLDALVLFLFARCRTGQCASVRIERDRAKRCLYPHRIQGAVLRFVIRGCAVTVFIAVLPAAPLLVKPAGEKIPLVPRYRHRIERLIIGDGHSFLRYRAAVAVEGDGVPIGGPHGIERQRLVCGIHIFEAVHLFAAIDGCPACLRIAAAGEQSAAQGKGNMMEFIICYGATHAVRTGTVGNVIAGNGKF